MYVCMYVCVSLGVYFVCGTHFPKKILAMTLINFKVSK